MSAWQFLMWPWIMGAEIAGQLRGPAGGVPEAPPPDSEQEWATPHRVVLELPALRLRDFSAPDARGPAVLVVAPFAIHDACIADLAPGHSLIGTLRAQGCERVLLLEWRPATPERRLETIDSQLAALLTVVEEIGAPVRLVGLCQGGWLSLIFAARFPAKVERLLLAGAPVDFAAAPSAFSLAMLAASEMVATRLLQHGGGRVMGKDLLSIWPDPTERDTIARAALQLEDGPPGRKAQRTRAVFLRWYERTLDLPGPYYLQILEWLYRQNRLAMGGLSALGREINPADITCPLALLAGRDDVIAPPVQVFAAAGLVGTPVGALVTRLAPCNHLALFMGQRTLREEWRPLARWLAA